MDYWTNVNKTHKLTNQKAIFIQNIEASRNFQLFCLGYVV